MCSWIVLGIMVYRAKGSFLDLTLVRFLWALFRTRLSSWSTEDNFSKSSMNLDTQLSAPSPHPWCSVSPSPSRPPYRSQFLLVTFHPFSHPVYWLESLSCPCCFQSGVQPLSPIAIVLNEVFLVCLIGPKQPFFYNRKQKEIKSLSARSLHLNVI